MQLLLRRNYLVIPVDQDSNEMVQVKTQGQSIEHQYWKGFISQFACLDGKAAYIPCNGWRLDDKDHWTYMSQGEFVAGVLTKNGVFAFYNDDQPVVVRK